MNALLCCMQCQVEMGVPNFSSLATMRIPDDGVLKATCDRGHQTFTIIQQAKFEILSQMAIKAIVDGYYRDAVASFGGALERLHEFFVRAACRKHGIDEPSFASAWKEMSNHSERQLGAFIGAHLIETRHPPKLLHQNQIKFRNAVIHKGLLPERGETISFGQAVIECAMPILQLMRSDAYSTAVHTLVMESIRDRSKPAWQTGQRVSTMSINTLLSLGRSEEQANVDAAVASYVTRTAFGDL